MKMKSKKKILEDFRSVLRPGSYKRLIKATIEGIENWLDNNPDAAARRRTPPPPPEDKLTELRQDGVLVRESELDPVLRNHARSIKEDLITFCKEIGCSGVSPDRCPGDIHCDIVIKAHPGTPGIAPGWKKYIFDYDPDRGSI